MKPSSILSFSLLLLLSQFSISVSEKCNPQDKKALLQIKKDLGNPYEIITWDPKTDCCTDWAEVTLSCDEKTHRVTSLVLDDIDGATGYLSPAFGDLPYLTSIQMVTLPNLSGPIPPTIAKLSKLTFLWISKTKITGPVPEFLSQLKKLTYINLSFNNLVGTIPPSLSQLPNLNFLRLGRNRLTGTIPESLSKLAPKLTDLYLGHNQLTGVVPASLLVGALRQSTCQGTCWKGTFHSCLAKTRQHLKCFWITISSTSTSQTSLFGKNLVWLDLNHNKIHGSLPKSLTKQEWQFFNVSYNRLCGKIPQGGSMQRIDPYSYLHNKCLCDAPLPPCK